MITNFKIFDKLDIPPVELKNFMVWKPILNNRYAILKLIYIDNDKHKVTLKRIFLFSVSTDTEYDISTENNIYEYSPRYVKENIIFESDDEQDCFDLLEKLMDAKKYNL